MSSSPVDRVTTGGSTKPTSLIDAVIWRYLRLDLIDALNATADFFTALIPGQSLLVHQDFGHWTQPWLVSQMIRFRDAFEPLAFVPDDTMVFLCRKPVDAERLAAARVGGLSDADIQRDLDAAMDWLAPFKLQDRLAVMKRGLALNPGTRIAWKMANRPW